MKRSIPVLAPSWAAFVASSVLLFGCAGEDRPTGAPDVAEEVAAPDTVTPDAADNLCGNGVVEAPERCDEGADNGLYARCASDCMGMAAHCGDGVVQPEHEVCDDAGDNGRYGKCGHGCNGPAVRCGNGFIEPEYEACDDGERNGTYGFCAADCQGPSAGCGDGVVTAPFESCDDGAENGKPGFCPVDCNPTPGCGDGVVAAPEACDDGTLNGTYGKCAGDCSGDGPRCGDGERDGKHEACDDGEENGLYGQCNSDCSGLGPHCGDGEVTAPEACDDGAMNGEDGHCNVECNGQTNAWLADPGELRGSSKMAADTCSEGDLLGKYMYYRKRFRGDGTAEFPGFISLGTAPGESIPASRREPWESCATHWSFAGRCEKPDLPDAHGMYNWGDGTIWHGEYLAMLALERAMFADLGWPTQETDQDIALALAALDRVDEKAETFYPGVAPARDGLFVRDDVPEDFHLKEGAYRFPREDGFAGYECASGDITCEPPKIDDGSFTSQDQTIALLFGLALVNRLVPHDLVVRGVRITEDAREKVHRLVWFLRSHGWKVKDPNGDSPPDAWGGNAIGFSNAMAKVANAVVGDTLGVDDYRNFASRTAGEASWAGLQVIWEATHGYNRSHALKLAAANGTWRPAKMAKMAMGDGKDYYALAYAALQGKTLPEPYSDWRIESLLASAPCSGPCRGPGCNEVPGWMGESRTMNPEQRFGSRHWRGEFNGMDYMATYAAYYLHRKGRYTHAQPTVAVRDCSRFQGLDQILASGPSDGQVYDPNDACAITRDFDKQFCRRPFSSWLEDAMQKKVAIWTAGGRWDCTSGGVCVIRRDDDENTNDDDLILGTPGNDELSGDSGNDCLMGFGGDDVLEGNQGFDELHGGDGNDRVHGEGSGLVLDGEADVLFGDAGDDFLDGAPGKDELRGGEGNDELDGGSGDDFFTGGPGNDVLIGNTGDDMMRGDDGDDALDGGWGSDALWGGPGRDKLDGDLGEDSLDGGTGPDFLRGGEDKDTLVSGDDWGTGELDHDRLCGNMGDDVIWAGWDGDECLGGGWFFGGTDEINGCDDETVDSGDCDKRAYDKW